MDETVSTTPQAAPPAEMNQHLDKITVQQRIDELTNEIESLSSLTFEPTEEEILKSLEIQAFIARHKARAIATGNAGLLARGVGDLLQIQELSDRACQHVLTGQSLRRNWLLRRAGLNNFQSGISSLFG